MRLTHHQHFPGIPSASGLTFHQAHYYIIGDDATQLFLLNADLTPANQIPLPGDTTQKRLPKPTKHDWESLSTITTNGRTALLALGSGSLAPYRNAALLFYPDTQKIETKDLSSFYQQISRGTDLNIEAATEIGEKLLIGNRGHLGKPENILILCDTQEIWQKEVQTRTCQLILPKEPNFSGISGLAWLPGKDWLYFTTSTEETASTYDDGKIGESRIGIIKNATKALRQPRVGPDEWFPLEKVHPVFKGQKIESICLRELKDALEITLVADNDDGGSHLFRLLF
ncbi:DUF6929 family protein [Chitinophaga barathri]|uniref:WD40 repeat domain-containing protein n=1 Tax=Chitinophaga barathri TaxID=1647451 RepID=A0A3N4MEP8_9BACT|nr:hypothetical protein [Chitinophaga barathri]RPD38189.1 hypothetical protein EG028_26380 [Chitinophaga barathri]